MAWYVFALVDQPPGGRVGTGFAAPVAFKRLPGAFAAVERRGDVPPVEMGSLKHHDRVVTSLWKSVPAILPVRFGALLELEELREMLIEREDTVVEAFGIVRERAQFTWRPPAGAPRAATPRVPTPRSGAEYLRRAAGQGVAIPNRYGSIRKSVAPYVQRERFQSAVAPRQERLYHLVAKKDANAYESAARSVAVRNAIAFTGPWPPYAFVPEIL